MWISQPWYEVNIVAVLMEGWLSLNIASFTPHYCVWEQCHYATMNITLPGEGMVSHASESQTHINAIHDST